SFNAMFGDGVCIAHGGQLITVDEFLAKLNPVDLGHPKWNNHPDELNLRSGDEISVTVRGGEFHTFTEVPVTDELQPGCLPPLNEALGITAAPPTDAQCADFFATSGVAANGGSTLTVSGLPDGEHLFMCEIHP